MENNFIDGSKIPYLKYGFDSKFNVYLSNKLNETENKTWTNLEISYLINNYSSNSNKCLSNRLIKTEDEIIDMAKFLNLQKI